MALITSEYPKIQSIYKRDEKTHAFIIGEFSLPEFNYLQNNIWTFTEKIDGMNLRIIWDFKDIFFKGKTDDAQIPKFLLIKLKELFTIEKFKKVFPDEKFKDISPKYIVIYGEGFGARIQRGGGKYIPDGVDFILFDTKIGKYWLKRDSLEDIASKLGIKVVPLIGKGTIYDAIELTKRGFKSTFGDFLAEGIVLKPEEELLTRSGDRVITKVKHKDFKVKG